MKKNMRKWLQDIIAAPHKEPIPILSFPAIQLMGITVKDFIADSEVQATGMKKLADRVRTGASVSLMDLSVEAECFGCTIHFSDDEVPTVVGSIASSLEAAQALEIPTIGTGRTGIYIDALAKALAMIDDRPVLAGIIGPFSLAGRLMDVSDSMIYCFEQPEMVHTILRKVTDFQIAYARAYKEIGAHGVVIAEPLAGLLSPALAAEFSAPYVKEIVDAVQTDDFIVVYHNCGDYAIRMIDSILSTGCSAYHFGNSIRMEEMLPHIPASFPVLGNISPADEFRNGTPESIRRATLDLLEKCHSYPNFVISSGCDIPAMSPWENIDAFFAAVEEFYNRP